MDGNSLDRAAGLGGLLEPEERSGIFQSLGHDAVDMHEVAVNNDKFEKSKTCIDSLNMLNSSE